MIENARQLANFDSNKYDFPPIHRDFRYVVYLSEFVKDYFDVSGWLMIHNDGYASNIGDCQAFILNPDLLADLKYSFVSGEISDEVKAKLPIPGEIVMIARSLPSGFDRLVLVDDRLSTVIENQ